MAQRPQLKRASLDALDAWLRLANDAGLLKRSRAQAQQPAMHTGPDIPGESPVELPHQQPGESPAGSPEEHPDSVPGEAPGVPPEEAPQRG